MDTNFINKFVFNVANKGIITYTLENQTNTIISDSTKSFLESRLAWIEKLIPIKFQEVNTNALLRIVKTDSVEGYPSYEDGLSRATDDTLFLFYKNDPKPISTRSQFVFIHELGHLLGLTHPYNASVNPEYPNSLTIMSGWKVNSIDSWRTSLSLFDFQNLKSVYGESQDVITGSKSDALTGTPGPDVLIGSSSDEVFKSRSGADWIVGGGGKDTFVFKRYKTLDPFNYDLIEDFGKNDSIRITGKFKSENLEVKSLGTDSWLDYKNETLAYFPDVSAKIIKGSLVEGLNG